MTQARDRGMSPALMAEQQRAKSEIEAALTIAAGRPRDQKEAMDKILTSCQRPGLAAKAKYRYSKGGTDIEGVTIDLMEVVAQNWGNLDFGFRELARFPGTNGGPGESVVEAFAWDLESNVKRKVQFTVPHAEKTKKGMRIITDPRDIYEWVANQAQRRVRTCLENIIPRDIYGEAADECEKTMQANVGDIKEAVAKLVPAFEKFGVTKEMMEARLQRRIETISAAQVVYLRTIWVGLRDGISHPEDWFDMTLGKEESESAKPNGADVAKEHMRRQAAASKQAKPTGTAEATTAAVDVSRSIDITQDPPQAPSAAPKPEAAPAEKPADVPAPQPAPQPDPPPAQQAQPPAQAATISDDIAQLLDDYKYECEAAETLTGLRELRKHAEGNATLKANPDGMSRALQIITDAEEKIRAARGGKGK